MNKPVNLPSSGTTHRNLWAVLAVFALLPLQAQAQYLSPGQLDNLVSRIALYPDPLLAQVLTASTYYDQIPYASAWADQHSYLQGDELARAIYADNLDWDASVQALLPFPSVLDTMEQDPGWTQALGNAVLTARVEVMDAIQRMRHRAYDYGYLRNCSQFRVVAGGSVIEIAPTNLGMIYVPVYDPYWIYAQRRPGFSFRMTFGPRIIIGASFGPVGWRAPRFDWRARTVIIDDRPWGRTAANRANYVHEYRNPPVRRAPVSQREYRESHETRPNRSAHGQRNEPARRDQRKDRRR
jgi:hypothetical protein